MQDFQRSPISAQDVTKDPDVPIRKLGIRQQTILLAVLIGLVIVAGIAFFFLKSAGSN